MLVLLASSPISAEDLWSSVTVIILIFGSTANCTKSPGGCKLIPFHNDWGHCSWEYSSIGNVFFPLSWPTLRHSFIMEVYREFLGLHGLVFSLICRELCTQVCALLIISSGFQSTWSHILRIIEAILEVWRSTANDLNVWDLSNWCFFKVIISSINNSAIQ